MLPTQCWDWDPEDQHLVGDGLGRSPKSSAPQVQGSIPHTSRLWVLGQVTQPL